MSYSDDPESMVEIALEDEERELLRHGLLQWLGPAHCSESMAVAMGFDGVDDLYVQGERITKALRTRSQLSRFDWTRTLLATEIVFASDVVGAAWDWEAVAPFSDHYSLKILRKIQRKLLTHLVPLSPRRVREVSAESYHLLGTERLWLRPLKLTDAKDLAEIYADPEVARYIGGAALDLTGTHQQLSRFEAEWGNRGVGQSAVLELASKRLIGRIGLHYWDVWGELELGYALETASQGKGYAAEGAAAWIDWAEQNLKQEYLIAVINPENKPSIKLARRLGFEHSRVDVTPSGSLVHIYRRDLAHLAPTKV
ncbi:GNAT family N-acetyltransferase [Psychromicrobium lacuslunae]|uniref:GNAT family N-acetyltransferase n=1 Tax=Psychromicrobium lacuslunae TaxID=1618207 RepID=UPI0009E3F47D|nr:GNAT family N-acetyltransferase [Psychromicrobium lacuslunae]